MPRWVGFLTALERDVVISVLETALDGADMMPKNRADALQRVIDKLTFDRRIPNAE